MIKQVIRVTSNTSVLKKKNPVGEMNDKVAIFFEERKISHISKKSSEDG